MNPAATLASGEGCTSDGDTVALEDLRRQRHAFNQAAIADKELQAIKGILHDDVILVTGTDSDVYSGAEAQLAIWRKLDGRWRLESEIFATEACGGDFCSTRIGDQ